jgi:hypothetical protein
MESEPITIDSLVKLQRALALAELIDAEEPAAEAVEGRELAKGNSPEQSASRTLGRQDTHSALERVRQAAQREDESASSAANANFEFLIARFGHVKVQMYRERGPHKRPHFHIEYKKEYRASYSIDTLERIIGFMPKQYERTILAWAPAVQRDLARRWEELHRDGKSLTLQLDAPTS